VTVPPIYLDHHATTPVAGRVLEAMIPYFTERFGNAASTSHGYGKEAREAVDAARESIGALIGAPGEHVIFTSGATESDNLALKGVAHHLRERGRHLVTQPTEHRAVLDSCQRLKREGFEITFLPVDRTGRVDPDDVKKALRDDTVLVSVMLANNEVGTVQDLAAIGAVTRERGVAFHCDAAQGVGLLPLDVEAMHLDLVSLSGHKMYGPKGVGALYVRRRGPGRVTLVAEMDGGGHENGMRSGTLNVPGVVGMGAAARVLAEVGPTEAARLRRLRDRLQVRLLDAVEAIEVHGNPEHRHPGNLNVSFAHLDGAALLMRLGELVAVSSGSACSSASREPSYVLRALGVDPERAKASIRFGLGRHTTESEIDTVADHVVVTVAELRERSPEWRQRPR